MAGFNEIQVGRYNRFLQKLLSMKGPASMNELSTTLQAVLLTFHGVENRYLEGWNRFAIASSTSAVAGQNSRVRFRNPAGSNVILVFESINASNFTATDSIILQNSSINISDLATPITPVRLDLRQTIGSNMIVSQGNSAADMSGAGSFEQRIALLNVAVEFLLFDDQEIPLLPGETIEIKQFAVNEVVSVSVVWRERFLEDSERA